MNQGEKLTDPHVNSQTDLAPQSGINVRAIQQAVNHRYDREGTQQPEPQPGIHDLLETIRQTFKHLAKR